MRILLANDDGIDAPGIALLRRAAARVASDIWVVAPERKWTAASHRLSFDKELTLIRRESQVYALNGTPADCVIAAMTVLFRDGDAPDLVLSGVNDGRNAAEDAAYSGTLSIAREASFWNLPAIGFSRTKGGTSEERDVAALAALIENLWQTRAQWTREGTFLSVNSLSKERWWLAAVHFRSGATTQISVARRAAALRSKAMPGASMPSSLAMRMRMIRSRWYRRA
jgi:5'-nucleotidase